MLQTYRELDKVVSFDARERLALAFATRAAVQKGRKLEQEQMEALVDDYLLVMNPIMTLLKIQQFFYVIKEIQRDSVNECFSS